jgi:hypothetical protein
MNFGGFEENKIGAKKTKMMGRILKCLINVDWQRRQKCPEEWSKAREDPGKYNLEGMCHQNSKGYLGGIFY